LQKVYQKIMAIRDVLFNVFRDLLIERPVRSISLQELSNQLSASGQTLATRYGGIANRDANREALRHIIGIERWGQQRLRAFLGQPFVRDEYEGYRPSESFSWNDLRDDFNQARAETVSLTEQLIQQDISVGATVPHNDFGPVTAKGWLKYMLDHAIRESTRIR
jgi:hypothetical protein